MPWLSTRRLVGRLLPSRPQEPFRTWPMLVRISDLQAFVLHMFCEICTKQVSLHYDTTITGMNPLGQPFLREFANTHGSFSFPLSTAESCRFWRSSRIA